MSRWCCRSAQDDGPSGTADGGSAALPAFLGSAPKQVLVVARGSTAAAAAKAAGAGGAGVGLVTTDGSGGAAIGATLGALPPLAFKYAVLAALLRAGCSVLYADVKTRWSDGVRERSRTIAHRRHPRWPPPSFAATLASRRRPQRAAHNPASPRHHRVSQANVFAYLSRDCDIEGASTEDGGRGGYAGWGLGFGRVVSVDDAQMGWSRYAQSLAITNVRPHPRPPLPSPPCESRGRSPTDVKVV